jgi:hypothetical protein
LQGKRKESAPEPVDDVEAALKRLRQDASDKEVAEALKRLKERRQ